MSAPTSKLTVRNLYKTFNTLNVLDDISEEVRQGEFVSIVGPSGCGKTTFLRIVGGLEASTSGETRLDGRLIEGPGSDRGFVFQQDNLLPWRTVLGNTVIGPEINGKAGPETNKRARKILQLVGLSGFEGYYPQQLSGGMRQRVNLARALVLDPELLLMDEPFSALDAQTREIMQIELIRIWEEGRKTVLFVTHQIDEAVILSDRILVFARRPGRIKEVVNVPLSRPRTLKMKRDPTFVALVDTIWRMIENDVRASVLEELA